MNGGEIKVLKNSRIFVFLSVYYHWQYHTKVTGDVSMAMGDFQRIIPYEGKIAGILSDFIAAEEEKLAMAKSYVSWFHKMEEQIITDTMALHPVSAFSLIRHLSSDWEKLRHLMSYDLAYAALNDIELHRALANFPREEDLKGAVQGIHRLQKTYLIDTEAFADGRIHGLPETPPLTAFDRFLIGKELANERSTQHYAVQWLESALSKLYQEEMHELESPQIARQTILEWLECLDSAAAMVSSTGDGQLNTTDGIEIRPYEQISVSETQEILCRGETSPSLSSEFTCNLATHNNPFLLLQPAKMETVYLDPEIYIIHDVVRPSQMEKLKFISQFFIGSETVDRYAKDKNDSAKLSQSRVAKRSHLSHTLDPLIQQLNFLAGVHANLNPTQAEELHVANYGLGGHFDLHYDFYTLPNTDPSPEIDPQLGDNIATFMVYLSDVEAGGATVFPRLNVTIYPEKGSAVFWYNKYRDGRVDTRTAHAGCPVLFGSKWVMNKWFREVQQDVTRPCALFKDGPDL